MQHRLRLTIDTIENFRNEFKPEDRERLAAALPDLVAACKHVTRSKPPAVVGEQTLKTLRGIEALLAGLPIRALPEITQGEGWVVANKESVENLRTTIKRTPEAGEMGDSIHISYVLDTKKVREGNRKYPLYVDGGRVNKSMPMGKLIRMIRSYDRSHVEKRFGSQDWTKFNRLTFWIYCDGVDVPWFQVGVGCRMPRMKSVYLTPRKYDCNRYGIAFTLRPFQIL
ncbi:unnamed protein product [marine sediment metagenome]|uniref:Uncharacterized protein n=1 Tax=marine sediment metagenome TaxID=412755 RepID=X1IUK6_9ZZZZ